MAAYLTKLAALAALVAPIFGAPAPVPHLKFRNPMAADVVSDSYSEYFPSHYSFSGAGIYDTPPKTCACPFD